MEIIKKYLTIDNQLNWETVISNLPAELFNQIIEQKELTEESKKEILELIEKINKNKEKIKWCLPGKVITDLESQAKKEWKRRQVISLSEEMDCWSKELSKLINSLPKAEKNEFWNELT